VVRHGSTLAERVGVPPMVVGLTVVSIGTSAPELAVGVDAMRADAGSLAIGNISGTNVVNLLLILGLCALIRPIDFHRRTLVLELPAMVLAAVAVYLFSLDGMLSMIEGVPLLLGAIAYVVLLGLWTLRTGAEGKDVDPLLAAGVSTEPESERPRGNVGVMALLLVVGIGIIVVGAEWLVGGAEDLARLAGVSDAFIGLTVVAIGTSSPELVTALVSTIRGDRDIAIGNLIGSSIFNLTLILGLPVLVAGGSGPIDPHLVAFDLPVMVIAVLACIPLFLTHKRLNRIEGGAMVLAYAVYLGYLISSEL
jgi:cation:H+ antiporter